MKRRRAKTVGVRTKRRGRLIIKTVYKRVKPRRKRNRQSMLDKLLSPLSKII